MSRTLRPMRVVLVSLMMAVPALAQAEDPKMPEGPGTRVTITGVALDHVDAEQVVEPLVGKDKGAHVVLAQREVKDGQETLVVKVWGGLVVASDAVASTLKAQVPGLASATIDVSVVNEPPQKPEGAEVDCPKGTSNCKVIIKRTAEPHP